MRRSRIFCGHVALAVALAGFGVPLASVGSASAAEPRDPLAAWTMQATFTFTEKTEHSNGTKNDFEFSATYSDFSTDSFVASWTASSSMTNSYPCDGGGAGGYTLSGGGSGAGEFWPETGFPSDYGIEPPYTGLEAGGGPAYTASGTYTPCGSDSQPTQQEQTPINNFVWLPATEDDLAEMPEGTTFSDTYSRVVPVDNGVQTGAQTWTVSYTARKGPWTDDPECSDGLDNDADGRVDAGSDPGCADAEDRSEHGPLQCDNGQDDDGDTRVDFLIGNQGDSECTGPEDDQEDGECVPDAAAEVVEYRTITNIKTAPDVHWYTTTVTALGCTAEDGQRFVSSLEVKRHAENGLVPKALGLLGWVTGTESPVEYDPDPIGRTTSASADFSYSECFDLTKLLDKLGAKKYLERKVQNKLEKLLGKMMKRLGYKRLKRKDRKEAIEQAVDALNDRFNGSTIEDMLVDKYPIPRRVARWGGELIEGQTETARGRVERMLRGLADSNELVKLNAEEAASHLVGRMFDKLDRLTTFCGGGTGGQSRLLTWNALATANVSAEGVEITRFDSYVHPLMEVRTEGEDGAGGGGGGAG